MAMSQEQCKKENLFRVFHSEPHLAFCVCLCSIKVSRPTSLQHTHTHTPSPLRSTRVTNPKVVYPAYCALPFFPFLLHLPWLGPKGPHGNSVSLLVYVSLSLFLSLSLCSSLFSPALLLCNLKPKSAKSFSCGFGSFQIPCLSPPGTAASPLHQQSLAFSMVL